MSRLLSLKIDPSWAHSKTVGSLLRVAVPLSRCRSDSVPPRSVADSQGSARGDARAAGSVTDALTSPKRAAPPPTRGAATSYEPKYTGQVILFIPSTNVRGCATIPAFPMALSGEGKDVTQ